MVVGAILEFRYAKLWNEHRSVGRPVGWLTGVLVGRLFGQSKKEHRDVAMNTQKMEAKTKISEIKWM